MSRHKDLASTLILLGGSLGFIFVLISLLMALFMAGMISYGYGTVLRYGVLISAFGMFGYPEFEPAYLTAVMAVWSLIGLVGTLLSIYCGIRLRKNEGGNVAFLGLVGGVLLLMAFSWLSSLLVLVGSILTYVEHDSPSSSRSNKTVDLPV